MLDMPYARAQMVQRQLASRGVSDPRVLAAMGETPREAFVPHGLQDFAYEDSPLPIEAGQTISQPYIVALMLEAAELALHDRVLAYDGGGFLDAAANARLVKNAEAYYRAMYYGAAESWNLRDTHMFETLQAVLDAHGPDAKAVVWAHNSHIGDAANTEMGLVRGELNIGQLCREQFGEAAALIGFGTHGGTVACASDWDGPLEVKAIRPSLPGSYERLAHESGVPRFLLDLRKGNHEPLRRELREPRLERFIGVIYRPETERLSHYSGASLPRQFDAYVWFDETGPVDALPTGQMPGVEDTYPFGL